MNGNVPIALLKFYNYWYGKGGILRGVRKMVPIYMGVVLRGVRKMVPIYMGGILR